MEGRRNVLFQRNWAKKWCNKLVSLHLLEKILVLAVLLTLSWWPLIMFQMTSVLKYQIFLFHKLCISIFPPLNSTNLKIAAFLLHIIRFGCLAYLISMICVSDPTLEEWHSLKFRLSLLFCFIDRNRNYGNSMKY